jgi:hypothetical protein
MSLVWYWTNAFRAANKRIGIRGIPRAEILNVSEVWAGGKELVAGVVDVGIGENWGECKLMYAT